MTDRVEQARAVEEAVGFRNREDLVVIRLEGEDQRSWLNGQVTGDVRNLEAGSSLYCLAVTVKGRIMADLWVFDTGEGLGLLIPQRAQEPLLASFESQIIMEDVDVVARPGQRVLSLLGPKASELARNLAGPGIRQIPGDELGTGGAFLIVEEERCEDLLAAATAAARPLAGTRLEETGYELARLRRGVPRFGVDFDITAYPQEAGLKERAVAFNKGCYLGQEVVCTLENRGKLARALHLLRLSTPVPPGTELQNADGQAVGRITSCVEDPELHIALALGYVKRASSAEGQVLRAGEADARIDRPVQ